MSSNETLIAPIPMDAEAGYTYQRADGTVEHALDAEDAIARCPVLGKLAIEAPDQANILLELAAAGKEKMQALQEQPSHKPEEKVHVETKQEPNPEAVKKDEHINAKYQQHLNSTDRADARHSEQVRQQAEAHVAEQNKPKVDELVANTSLANVAEKVIAEQPTIEPVNNTKSLTEVPITSIAARTYNDVAVAHKDKMDVFMRNQEHEATIEKPLVAETEMSELPDQEAVNPVTQEAVYKTPAVTDKDDEQLPVEPTLPEPTETIQTISEVLDTLQGEPLEVSDEVGHITKNYEIDELLLSVATEEETTANTLLQEVPFSTTDEQSEVLFEPEIIETYKELMELTVTHEPEQLTLEEPIPTETHAEEDGEMTVDFAIFIAEQPEVEEVVPLETMIEQADEQPLEQTFVQLARYLSDTLQENQDTAEASDDDMLELSDKYVEVRAILQDIAEILPARYSVNEETQDQRLPITPEMTQNLLLLLRSLGYEQPREVLIEFVRLHRLAFLLQALQYMCQLNNEENRQEFYVQSTTYAPSDDGTARLRLGKVLLGLSVN